MIVPEIYSNWNRSGGCILTLRTVTEIKCASVSSYVSSLWVAEMGEENWSTEKWFQRERHCRIVVHCSVILSWSSGKKNSQ